MARPNTLQISRKKAKVTDMTTNEEMEALYYLDSPTSTNLPRSLSVIPRARMTAALTPSSIMACVKSVALRLKPAMESLAPMERMLRVAEMMPIKRNGRKEVACTCK